MIIVNNRVIYSCRWFHALNIPKITVIIDGDKMAQYHYNHLGFVVLFFIGQRFYAVDTYKPICWFFFNIHIHSIECPSSISFHLSFILSNLNWFWNRCWQTHSNTNKNAIKTKYANAFKFGWDCSAIWPLSFITFHNRMQRRWRWKWNETTPKAKSKVRRPMWIAFACVN